MADVGRIKFIDRWIGVPICMALSILNRLLGRRQRPDAKRILVIQLWGIGESILTLPAIKAISETLGSRLTVLCTERNRDVFDHGFIHEVRVSPLSPGPITMFMLRNFNRYDLVVDMEEYLNISAIIAYFVGRYRIGFNDRLRGRLFNETVSYDDRKHTADAFMDLARKLGFKGRLTGLVALEASAEDARAAGKFLRKNKIGEGSFLVGMTPGAAESSRCRMWPKERFAEIARHLIDYYNAKVILIGSAQEDGLNQQICDMVDSRNAVNAAGKLTLRQTFSVIKRCSLFISNDTGPMHIAAAQGCRTVGIFGPNTPVRWAPFGRLGRSVYRQPSCRHSPCINTHLGQVPDCLYSRESTDYQKCMKAISADDVIRTISGLTRSA
ncbi:MAG: glycosyltransferase family 9 protein [archaeon]